MVDFFELWDRALNVRPHLRLEVGYTRITDYCVIIHDNTGRPIGDAKHLFTTQNSDYKVAMAEAYVWLVNFLLEECGGY